MTRSDLIRRAIHPYHQPGRRMAVLGWLLAMILVLPPGQSAAQNFTTQAEFALLMDAGSGTILYSKNADAAMAPASMAKLMTVAVVLNEINGGRLSLDDKFLVSENAWRRGGANSGGSTMFAELNSEVSVRDLLYSVIIQSGNDACIILAEGIAGTEDTFALMMNERAQSIGLRQSIFTNSTGLPDPAQRVTAIDLATLALHLIDTHPEYYSVFQEPAFEWNGINQRNRNPLLARVKGADGLKTGFTEESGFGFVGSALRDGERMVVVVNGLKTRAAREAESRKLIEWGFRGFERLPLFPANTPVSRARVFGGDQAYVTVGADDELRVLMQRGNRSKLRARYVYNGPIEAPVRAGQSIGHLKVWSDDTLIQALPLVALEDVPTGGLVRRATDALNEFVMGWF